MKHNLHPKTAVLAAGLVVVSAVSAFAGAKVCATHDKVTTRLYENFGETLQSVGITKSNYVVEVFASHRYGTWTITVRKSGGPTCLIASGNGYDRLSKRLASL